MPNVLIVDDHREIADALVTLVESLNCQAATVQSGKLALEYVHHNAIDLMVLDVSMPELNGIDVLKRLREQRQFIDLPVVMFSASDSGREECMELGAMGFVSKSRPDELVHLIQTVAAGRGQGVIGELEPKS